MEFIGAMQEFDLNDIDFRALRTLKLVHDLRSFTLAAERLGQNQSTVSYAMRRLRAVFGDELFVRQGRSIAPTQRCSEIVAGVERLFDQLADIAEPAEFDPAQAEARIVVSCNHYERAVILPAAIRRLREEAPGIKVRVIQARVEGHQQLRKGECDLLLSPVSGSADGLFTRRLAEDRYVCVMDPQNPLAGSAITLEAYAAANHIFISYEGSWRPSYRDFLEARGIFPKMVIDLPSSAEIGQLVRGTDLVATVTSQLAASFAQDLAVVPGPFDSRVVVHQFWTQRTHRSRVHRWFRDLLATEASAAMRKG